MFINIFDLGTSEYYSEGRNKRIRLNNFILSSFVFIKIIFLIFYASQGLFSYTLYKSISLAFTIAALCANFKGLFSLARVGTMIDMLSICVLQIFLFGPGHPFLYMFFLLPITIAFVLFDVQEKIYSSLFTFISISLGSINTYVFDLYPHKIILGNFDFEIYMFLNFTLAGVCIAISTYWLVLENNKTEEKLKSSIIRAEAATTAKSNFLSVMSHEIRTPLNGVVALAELLEKECETQNENILMLNQSAKNLMSIVNNVLDFSKIEAGKLKISNTAFNLYQSLKIISHASEIRAIDKGLSFRLVIAEDVPEFVVGDQMRLNQIVLNFIDNSIKFTEKGLIELSIKVRKAYKEKTQILFEITDTGIGIPEAQISSVFEKYSSVSDSTTRQFEGTGLGMSICNSLIKLHGGQLTIHSRLNIGTSIKFFLPYKKVIDIQPLKESNSSKNEEIETPISILYVEDNEINQFVSTQLFKTLKLKYEVFDNAEDALKMSQSSTYDLILTDYHMPNMNGIELAKAIRKDKQNPNKKTPILLITADVFTSLDNDCKKAGINELLIKPIDQKEFRAKILKNCTQHSSTI